MVKFPRHIHVLSFDERDHIIREWCDGQDPSVSLALWSFSLLLLLFSWLIHVHMTMRLCNSQILEEHLVCYHMSQRNCVIIKMLYKCLRWCLLSWHRLRLGFGTPCIKEVSLGPLGNAHHYEPCKQCDQWVSHRMMHYGMSKETCRWRDWTRYDDTDDRISGK